MTQSEMSLDPKTPVTAPPAAPTPKPDDKKPEAPPIEPPKPEPPKAAAPLAVSTFDDDPDPGASRALSAFSSEAAFKAAFRMARAMAQSSIVPKEYQGDQNVPNILIAMELANRIGASVLMVMQSLDLIHGRPAWRATFLIATVNQSNRFTPLRFRWFGEEGTKTWGCRCVAKDKQSGEECQGALITMELAQAEGWTTKNGSKWRTMPEQMLMYRAAAFWTRVYAPELSLGMQTREEVIDTYGEEMHPAALPPGIAPGSPSALENALKGAGAIA